ncbi:MAG: hypothetical protein KA251_00455 [Saprospiraceae bacterium]|nr:hypothetical protein [Candidatus Vicinibacter affinis]MBP6173001.1 hypothetical protein [Saprospiraceae bacterium]MBK6572889.1 hypothetical protein [Candidatus Vicinibacter affinis]MBK7302605.1 hypothetical protein [Candidatus Vicinibacter affinis]MBK7695939.1 hypothetical protein [Candidatus Vicinibacter affinis]
MKLKPIEKINWKNGLLIFICSTGCFSNRSLQGDCTESPKLDCICTMDYNPVCGCNQKTYANACSAECAGIKIYKSGKCN